MKPSDRDHGLTLFMSESSFDAAEKNKSYLVQMRSRNEKLEQPLICTKSI